MVFTHKANAITSKMERNLLEKDCDTFIRYNEAISIMHKVRCFNEQTMNNFVSSRKPFGLPTTFRGHKSPNEDVSITLYQNGGLGYVSLSEIEKNKDWVKSYKVFIPRAGSGSDAFPHPILGQPMVAPPNSACTETYMVIGPYANEEKCENVVSYIKTKFFRFMVLLKKNTQDAPPRVYSFVPLQDFSKPWTDEELYAKYGLTEEEIAFIESMIRPME